jgi:2-polyprenyl-6-hydroxyphenyl methylase/3-demethylubiquinone-9 3-methyltransferase
MPAAPTTPVDLTSSEHWDANWDAGRNAAPIARGRRLYIDAICDALDEVMPRGADVSTVELGGAPGRWLVYVHRAYRHRVALVDYSPVGVAQARAALRAEGIDAAIHQGDIFDPNLDVGRFDVVYSLGLVEHFDELTPVLAAHARFARPGGLVVIGMPSYRGVNRLLKRWLQPAGYAVHNVDTMRLAAWEPAERELDLERVFGAYIGGFEPLLFKTTERSGLVPRAAALAMLGLGAVLNLPALRALRRLNGPLLSNYLLLAYRVP